MSVRRRGRRKAGFRAVGLCLAAVAAPGLACGLDLGLPEVTKGATELRNVNVVDWDKHDPGSPRHVHEFQVGYGFTDEFALKAILSVEGADGLDAHAAIGAIEATYEAIDVTKGGFGLAWYGLLDIGLDGVAADDLVLGPILKWHSGAWDIVTNTYAVRSLSGGRGGATDFNYVWQIAFAIDPHVKIGMEGDGLLPDVFHLDPQPEAQHRIGPVLMTTFDSGGQVFTLDLGVQFGLSDPCPDTEAKIVLGTIF